MSIFFAVLLFGDTLPPLESDKQSFRIPISTNSRLRKNEVQLMFSFYRDRLPQTLLKLPPSAICSNIKRMLILDDRQHMTAPEVLVR